MIMIIDEIKKANMLALKEHNDSKRTAYSMLMNKYMLAGIELKAQGKEIGDTDMIQIIQKSMKELDEELENYKKAGREDGVKDIEIQKETIAVYLPKMMSKDEILLEINKLEDKSIGVVMKHFKINFAGKCDMRDVQEVLKSL
ncbi:MAG: GatB/YqeY domain-containing protein [Clostridia bacterium]|nr:GatB/YqeY domain-containing protein [Clostridia bacterium]